MTLLFRAIRIARKRLRLLQRAAEKHLTPLREHQARRLLQARRQPYEAWLDVNQPSRIGSASLILALSQAGKKPPSISVIMPVYRAPLDALEEAIASVKSQTFQNWELCIADDSGMESDTRNWLRGNTHLDPRIHLTIREKNGGIAAATNSAASIAKNDILVFLDQDDLLHEDCLAEIALYYAKVPFADVVYTDHDKIDKSGNRFDPAFKPGWSPTLLLSHMYLGHTLSVRRALFEDVGGVRPAFDGAQDFDLALRLSEKARHIGHIPRILYHWRVSPGSTAASGDAKPESLQAGHQAVTEALARRNIAGEAVQTEWSLRRRVGLYKVAFRGDLPKVTVVLPRLNDHEALQAMLKSFAKTDYPSWDILTDNDLPSNCHVSLSLTHVQIDAELDGAARWQAMAFKTDAPFVMLLASGVSPLSKDWLKQLVGQAVMAEADVVGGQSRRMYGKSAADPFSRVPKPWQSGSFDELHNGLKGYLTIGYNATTGISTLRVEAFSPKDAQAVAQQLLIGGERLINNLNERANQDAVSQAEMTVERARSRLVAIQGELTAFRNREQFFDPEQSASVSTELIGKLAVELATARAERALVAEQTPQSPTLPTLDGRIRALNAQLEVERGRIAGDNDSLVRKAGAYEAMILNRELASRAVTAASASLETAQIDARRQKLYLDRVVDPTLPSDASQPKRLLSILAVFATCLLIYGGGWLVWAGLRESRHHS